MFAMPVAGSTTTGFEPSVASPACGSRPPQLLTYTFRPSAVVTVLYGKAPVATCTTARLLVSMIPSALLLLSATYSLSPVGLRLSPLGEAEGIDSGPADAHTPVPPFRVKIFTSLSAPPPT